MIFLNKRLLWNLRLSLILVLVVAFVTACASSSSSDTTTDQQTEGEENEEHEENEESGEHEESEEPERVPNEGGAVIRIVSPANGATFKSNEDIVVEIETENFTLGEEERHWEVFVDGASYGSVEGGTDEVLRGLEVGEHEISVFMSLGSHQQFEDGDAITITVEE